MKAMYICGTDTGVGKTIVTGYLAHYLLAKGYRVVTQKWIETGSKHFSRDLSIHLKIMKRGREDFKDYLPFMAPYVFKFPSSPHLAANLEGKRIEGRKIRKSFRFLVKAFDCVFVEGTGGLFVPVSSRETLLDIVKSLNLPVLIVAANKLGAINHTLLTVEALRTRRIQILGITFVNVKGENKKILDDNPKIVNHLTRECVFGTIPHTANYLSMHENFLSIGKRIFQRMRKLENE